MGKSRPLARSRPGFKKQAEKAIDNGLSKPGGKPDGVRTACLITETAKKFDIPVSVLFVAAVRHDKFLHVSETEAADAAMVFLSNGKEGSSPSLTRSVRVFAERINKEKNPQQFLRGLGVDVPRRSTPLLGGKGRGGIANEMSLSE